MSSRRRGYGCLVSRRDNFGDVLLRSDVLLLDVTDKKNVRAFNNSERQFKRHMEKKIIGKQYIFIEKIPTEGADGGESVRLLNQSNANVLVDGEIVAPDSSCELKVFQSISLENGVLAYFIDFGAQRGVEIHPAAIQQEYRIKRADVGFGATGQVFQAFSMDRKQICALKRIDKVAFKEADDLCCFDELNILKELKHPNIIDFYKYLNTERYLYLELSFAEYGNLYDMIYTRQEPLDEKQVKRIVYQLFHALDFLHEHGVTHRDIKGENVLLMENDRFPLTKLADFGASHIGDRDSLMTQRTCTLECAAPEQLAVRLGQTTDGYTNKVDCWSMGVLVFECIARRYPYPCSDSPEAEEVLNRIRAVDVPFEPQVWDHIAPEAKDLVRGLLTVQVDDRLTAKQALEHGWFRGIEMIEMIIWYAQKVEPWRNTQKLAERTPFTLAKGVTL